MRNKREHIRYHHRAVQSNTEFLKYQKRLRATLCYSVVIAIIISLVSCRYSRPNLDDEGISDKTRDLPLRPALYVEYEYGSGAGFRGACLSAGEGLLQYSV